MANAIFIDWITITQHHAAGGLPIIAGGCLVWYDANGNPRRENLSAASLGGSWDSAIRIRCDGHNVSLSGNVGRFNRRDNLFNHGWPGTLASANKVLGKMGLPGFTVARHLPNGTVAERGATVSRLDLTANFATGADYQARSVIRWLAGRAVHRVKRGVAGDESVWWANTRHMFKAYLKAIEMKKHAEADELLVAWLEALGVVRIEVELKRRLLEELGLRNIGDITQEKLEDAYREQTEILREVDRSDDTDLLAAVPMKCRSILAAWLSGYDPRTMCSERTLFRHAAVLREYGINIMAERDVTALPVRVRTLDLVPMEMPEWYSLDQDVPKLKIVGDD